MKQRYLKWLTILPMVIIAAAHNVAFAQSDTTKAAISDTIKGAMPDNINLAMADTTPIAKVDTARHDTVYVLIHDTVYQTRGKDKRRKDEFIIYGGGSANHLDVSSTKYESTNYIGYHLGAAYKRGKFFYWQAGARFNYAQYELKDINNSLDSGQVVPVSDIDIPLTAGINVLAFVNRVVGLRLFVSVVPSFTLGVGENMLGIKKENVNSYMTYGQAGAGLSVAFFLVEAGYNYGFQNLFKYDVQSRPGQFFVNLGFRF